jgi:UDP-N-acetylglucosamine 2-epimerase (non-hydrolysing)
VERPGAVRKVLIVVGTRPEAIKMAPLILRLRSTPGFRVTVCSTGQHQEMIRQVFTLFSIKPDVDLNIMQPDQGLGDLTSRALVGIEKVIGDVAPDRVLVHGDTTTTLAASLAAFYRKTPVGHVEAGLRTGDIYAPWPEEINRKLTDAIADRLYAPTQTAKDNLLREGAKDANVIVTGNTVIDALFDVVNGPLKEHSVEQELATRFSFLSPGKKTILVTCHRRESFGAGFRDICRALASLAERADVQIVFPVHRNPNVRTAFRELEELKNVRLMEPVDYLEFVFLLSKCFLVLTDSGGIQEEAPSLGKPVLVLRAVTERPEAVLAGTVKLVGTETRTIVDASNELLNDHTAYTRMSTTHNPYGDGKACERITASLSEEM